MRVEMVLGLIGLVMTGTQAFQCTSESACGIACTILGAELSKLNITSDFDVLKCVQGCNDELSATLSPSCVKGLCEWAVNSNIQDFTHEAKLIEADFTSSKTLSGILLALKWFSSVVGSKGKLPDGWLAIQKGYIKNFGSYDACKAIDGAEYCLSRFESPPMNGKTTTLFGPFASCVPNQCGSTDIKNVINATIYAAFGLILPNKQAQAGLTNAFFEVVQINTNCGDKSYEWTAGAGIMIALVSMFALLSITTAFYFWIHSRCSRRRLKGSKLASSNGYTRITNTEGDPDGGIILDQNSETSDQKLLSSIQNQSKDKKGSGQMSLLEEVLTAVSLTTAWKSFLTLREGTGTEAMDGVRVFSMGWVVFGHVLTWPLTAGGPGYSNIEDLVPYGGDKNSVLATPQGQAIPAAEFSVDTFFFMSGFLAAYISLKKLRNRTPADVLMSTPALYLNRWLRITPLYMIIIWFYTEVIPLTMSGPTFDMDGEIKACKDNWWYNFLYVQTVFPRGVNGKSVGDCYGVSWYLANDMIFFWATPWILAAYKLNKILGIFIPSLLTCASIAASWVIAWKHHLRFPTFDQSEYFPFYYKPPWTRAPPYLIGLLMGIGYYEFKRLRYSIPRKYHLSIQAGLGGLCAIIFGSTVYGTQHASSNVPSTEGYASNNAYIALAKPAWSIGLAAMLFLCFQNLAGPVGWILSLKFFQYVSKLTFCMYLLHPMILALIFFNRVYPIYYTNIYFAIFFISDGPLHYTHVNFSIFYISALASTAFLSLIVFLTIETPLANLQKSLMIRMLPSKPGQRRVKTIGTQQYAEPKDEVESKSGPAV